MILPANPLANYLHYKHKIDSALSAVLESGRYILGEQVTCFEQEFARYVGCSHSVGVANGTEAIQTALLACGIGVGDQVVTVSHTAVATVCAIELTGARPILVDIDPRTFTIDVNKLEDTLKQHTHGNIRAIVPVHLYGHPADMNSVLDIAGRYGLFVIEDCAQAHGAIYHDRKVGAFGHFGAFSFYPTKNLGALGDGGAVTASDSPLAEKARTLRQYGWKQRYISDERGLNTRLDELQASILRVKLRHLDSDNDRRRSIAARYNSMLAAFADRLPAEDARSHHVYHQYVIRSNNRTELKAALSADGIESAVLYPVPIHLQPAYSGSVRIGSGGLAVTEQVCREILSLPMYPELTDGEVSRVADCVHKWFRTNESLVALPVMQ